MQFPNMLIMLFAILAIAIPTFGAAIQNLPRQGTNPTLNAINHYRTYHGVPILIWNTTMADYASTVSNSCAYPTAASPYKQHIFEGANSTATALQVWYDLGDNYNYSADPNTTSSGNIAAPFTQMIWKSATQLGCASTNCTGSNNSLPGIYLTCEYDIGNIPGEYTENVLPVGSDIWPGCC